MEATTSLRIGNYLFGIDEGYRETAMEVYCINGDITYRLKQGEDSVGCYKQIRPIPLSEEWLVSLGFESVNGVCFKKGDLIIEDADSLWEVSWMPERLLYLRMIEHVHQLQNLYYALTGNELTV